MLLQSKTTVIVLVAISFVAGSVVSGTSAYASGDKNGKPFEELWEAIHALEGDMDDIEEDLEDIVYDAEEESGLTKTYVKTDTKIKKLFCDVGDYATNGGGIADGSGRPLNADGDVAASGEAITGWENISGSTSFVVCLDVT